MMVSCDWFYVTIMINVYDLFFRNKIPIVLLPFIVLVNESERLFIYWLVDRDFYAKQL